MVSKYLRLAFSAGVISTAAFTFAHLGIQPAHAAFTTSSALTPAVSIPLYSPPQSPPVACPMFCTVNGCPGCGNQKIHSGVAIPIS